MFCKNCGKEVPNDVRFCTGCGQPMEENMQTNNYNNNPTNYNSTYGNGINNNNNGNYNNYSNQGTNGQYQRSNKTSGFSVAGLVLGIISIVTAICLSYIGTIVGIIGLVFSLLGRKENKDGMSAGGIACSSVGIAIGIILVIIYLSIRTSSPFII